MCKSLKIKNYYIVYGNNRIKKSKIINNMIIVKSPDNYISLPLKMTELLVVSQRMQRDMLQIFIKVLSRGLSTKLMLGQQKCVS